MIEADTVACAEARAVPLLHTGDLFPPWLRWGFTTRHGGVSTGPYATLNLGWSVGDRPACVRENHARLATTLGYDRRVLASVHQVHGRRVLVARTAADARALRLRSADGIVLAPRPQRRSGRRTRDDKSHPVLAALVRVADCCPVIVAARDRPAAAVLHCGWRSLLRGLIAAGVAALVREVGRSRPALAAAVGPCIGPEAFEVGEEVAEPFAELIGPSVVLRRPGRRRPHVDLQAAVRLLLIRAGIPDERIVVFRHCTFTERSRFFSYRRDGPVSGRQVGIIALAHRPV